MPLLRFPARSVSETTESHSAPAAVLSTILAAAILLVSCDAQPVKEAENLMRKVTVETEVLQPQDFRSMLSVIGTVKSEFDARISAEVAGTLTSFSADKGDMVRKGDVIAILDDAKLRQEVLRLEAAVSQAKDAFDRQQTLFDNNIGSATERDNAKYLYDQQAAALASLKVDLENTRIRAPFSGRIEATYSEVGELLAPGAPVFRIVDATDVKIETGVPALYANAIEMGDRVRFTVNRDPAAVFEGEIVFVGMAVDPANRTFQVEIRPLDLQNRIKVDMIADVEFIIEDRPSSIVVSGEFLFSDGDGLVAYVVSADEAGQPVARKVEVTTGPSYKNRFVVTGGLNAGDRFITRGSSYLDDGTRIVLPEAVASNS